MAMTSRERLETTLSHEAPDRVCVGFGGTNVTGIAASAVSRLRKALLGDDDYKVKVVEPYQVLGEIDPELREALGIDVIGVMPRNTIFGFPNTGWKPFTLFDGTDVLVPGDFNVTAEPNGDLLIYPQGDTSVPPSGRMPRGGFYFDAICRQEPIDEESLDPADNTEDFALLTDDDVKWFADETEQACRGTDSGIILTIPGAGFGDIALVPAMWMKRTKGIREIEEWYISTVARRGYVEKVFEKQLEVALANLRLLVDALGDRVQAALVTGTDFGTQRGPFIGVQTYRELYKPYHKAVNDFIHENTSWKTFIHSCGSVVDFIPDFIDAGFDILNPVQCSAAGMDPKTLKREFGRDITFWGGGVDTQKTLPFGTPDDVYSEVRERIEILGEGGGFVFNAIHNIQANSPTENMLAMFRALRDSA